MSEVVIKKYELVLRETDFFPENEPEVEAHFEFTDDEILTIRRVLATVAQCSEAYELGGKLADAFGELSDEDTMFYGFGRDGVGCVSVMPSSLIKEGVE